MRQAALSMVAQNMKLLGCRYPADVEQIVGAAGAAGRGTLLPGGMMAVEGERRAEHARATVSG